MKVLYYTLILVALSILIFNLFQVNWSNPISGKSAVAVICAIASASAILLLIILILSKKIAERLNKK
ncbi:MAG: hypothetical protein ACJ0PU_00640 [Flavobacteriaceae bacterium]